MNCSDSLDHPKTQIDIAFSVLINIANVVGIVYNVPQMYHTYKRKSTKDISPIFLHARFWCSLLWTVYCVYYHLWYVLVSWITTGSSSVFMLYYMHIYPRINKNGSKAFLPVNTQDPDDIDDELINQNKIEMNNSFAEENHPKK
jgi:uncharacterized protein with PQ loop repeat